jgi:hypothetical protein
MTRRPRTTANVAAQPRSGLGETRDRFLLARRQAAVHASAAAYCRVRDVGSWTAPRRDQ